MDRKQEYDTLMQELRQTPPALEGTLDRALDRRRARRRKLRPLRSLAAAAAVFVLLVNVSIPFAQACTHIPVLGWLAQAVCFSHSLSSAVEHDWVQKVEQTQRDNGYTLTLEDLIVDQKQIHFFYTLDWEDPACEYAMVLVDGDRLSPRPTVLSDSVEGPQDAGHIVLDYREGQVPDRLDLVLTVRPNGDGSPAARFRFQVALDPSLTAVGQVRPVEQWVELDGQQIYVDCLEIYPTHARLLLRDHPDNTARLVSLLCHLEDETGRRYEREGGLSSFSDPDTGFLTELRLSSPYFQPLFPAAGAADPLHHRGGLAGPGRGGGHGGPDRRNRRRPPGGGPADPGGPGARPHRALLPVLRPIGASAPALLLDLPVPGGGVARY